MTGFFRPEARALVWRWREVLAALAVVGLGLWVVTSRGVVVSGFGYVLIAIGAVGLVPALRRARFAAGGDGPGIVQLDEGRVTYMGPVHGGVISLDEIEVLSLRRTPEGGRFWVLAEGAAVLVVPVDALGAEALFDGFARLPGLSSARLLEALDGTAPGTTRLWQRRAPPALTP